MAKVILDAIEQLEIYTTNKVQEWKEVMQRPHDNAHVLFTKEKHLCTRKCTMSLERLQNGVM